MRKTLLAVCGVALGLGLAPAYAQTLQMTETPPAQTQVATATPDRGMSKAQVEARYGAPSEKVAAVGNPPISRWVYPNFIVYFEYNHVIHAVATPATK